MLHQHFQPEISAQAEEAISAIVKYPLREQLYQLIILPGNKSERNEKLQFHN